MPKIVIITGSRTWTDENLIEQVVKEHSPQLLVQGGCPKGADKISKRIAEKLNIPTLTFRADWDFYGKSAGPIRNCEMLDNFPKAILLAFRMDSSVGTTHCIVQAKKRNMTVQVFDKYSYEQSFR